MGKKPAAKMSLAQFHMSCSSSRRTQHVLPLRSQGLSLASGRLSGKISRDFGVDGRADVVDGECEGWQCAPEVECQALGEVPQWWTDPDVQSATVNHPMSAASVEPHEDWDIYLAEAVTRSNATFADEMATRNRCSSQATALSAFDVNGNGVAAIAPCAPHTISHILKASLGSDRRRLSVSWLAGTSARLIFELIRGTISESFSDLNKSDVVEGLRLTYVDDEGDECTLVESTLEDFFALAGNSALRVRVDLPITVKSDVASDTDLQDLSITSPLQTCTQTVALPITGWLDEGEVVGAAALEEFDLATPRSSKSYTEVGPLEVLLSRGISAEDERSDEAHPNVVPEKLADKDDEDSMSVEWTDVSGLGCEVESCEIGCESSCDDFELA